MRSTGFYCTPDLKHKKHEVTPSASTFYEPLSHFFKGVTLAKSKKIVNCTNFSSTQAELSTNDLSCVIY